jgi:hypothetical protein
MHSGKFVDAPRRVDYNATRAERDQVQEEEMASKTQPAQVHRFGQPRPAGDGNFKMHVRTPQEVRDTHYRDLPPPTGKPPYQLSLADILPAKSLTDIEAAGKLTFHVNGDMGGINFAVPQELVARGMEADFDANAKPQDNPAFLYILGDCVYFNGEVTAYRAQFFEPYRHYNAPIFAVPGNHDGEDLAGGKDSLDGFVRFFCADCAKLLPEAGDTGRTTMTQPNVFWTLRTPLVNFVGLYSNVPEGGDIRAPQTQWLTDQLKSLPKGVPLVVTLHHPVFSADTYHSGSSHMKDLIDAAAKDAGRQPDMVLAGHVHNFQRITRHFDDDTVTPYIVAGAGGYHNLHTIMKVDGEKLIAPTTFIDKEGEHVTLERYSDDNHGFLRLEVTASAITGRYYIVPRPQEPYSKGSTLIDYFEFDWKRRRYLPNTLKADSASADAKTAKTAKKARPPKKAARR